MLGGQPVTACGNRLSQGAAVFRQVQDRGIVPLSCCCTARAERRGRQEGAAQEVTPPGLYIGDLGCVEEIFGGADYSPGTRHGASLGSKCILVKPNIDYC